MVMMVAASLCGATTATEFALFAENRKAALSRLIDYDSAPSHDTFSRLLRLMNPEAFERAFAVFAEGFARALAETSEVLGEVVALDGKALRRAYERGHAASPPLTVSAFATATRLCLGAATPRPGENEVEAALKVVELIDLTGKIVTADALHCHRRMAEALVDGGAGYVLALKGNRRHWRRRAEELFAQSTPLESATQSGLSHGRNEWRQADVVATDSLSCRGMPPLFASPLSATKPSR